MTILLSIYCPKHNCEFSLLKLTQQGVYIVIIPEVFCAYQWWFKGAHPAHAPPPQGS